LEPQPPPFVLEDASVRSAVKAGSKDEDEEVQQDSSDEVDNVD